MKLIFLTGFLFSLFFISCSYLKGGKPSDVYLVDSLDSLNRPRLPLPDRELVSLSVVEDSTMKYGLVRVRIIISEDGKVIEPVIERSLGPREDSVAISRVRSLPDFIPGNIGGRPVKVVYYLPFIFNPDVRNSPGKR